MRAHTCTLVAALALAAAGCGEDVAEPAAPAESPTLFFAGDGELWTFDTGSEVNRHFTVPQLSPGDPPHRIAIRGDRLVLWGYDTWSVPADDPGSPPDRIVDGSWIWIPSAHPDRVWVGYLDPEHQPRARPLSAVREIDADGNVTVPDTKPPEGQWPQVALESGLLFTRGDVVVLWDPRSRKIVHTAGPADSIGFLGPAHGDQVASCGFDGCRAVVLTDFASGRQRSIPAPDGYGFEISQGAFSPDGSALATTVREIGKGADPARLALISIETGEVTVVPDSGIVSDYAFAAWDTAGEHVFLTGWGTSHEPVLVTHSPGDDGAQRFHPDVGRFYDVAAR